MNDGSEYKIAFSVQDPKYRNIILVQETYERKVKKHPEFSGDKGLNIIKKGLEDPNKIVPDKDKSDTQNYQYEHCDSGFTKYGNYLKIAVNIWGKQGRVKTFYFTDTTDKGKPIYEKN